MTDRIGTPVVPAGARVLTRGVVFVHSCPRALAAHVEWAVADVLGCRVALGWSPQPVEPGSVRAELSWAGPAGTAAQIISSVHTWSRLRVEATEEPTATTEGRRYSVTPGLGIFRATVGIHGDIQVPEERLRGALIRSALTGSSVEDEVAGLLGTAWDAELEPFRCAADDTPVRWLHQVV